MGENKSINYQTSNGIFTWTNHREGFTKIVERLDRFLVAASWMEEALILNEKILPISMLDHFPVEQLELKNETHPHQNIFQI